MHKVTLEINSSVYDKIMFFLDNLPKNMVQIKTNQEFPTSVQTPIEDKLKTLQGLGKELYQGVDSDRYIKDLRDEW